MKNVKSILNHIFPTSKKIEEHRCFSKILSLFPKNLKEHTIFCFKRDKTLFFVIDHPAIKMEFNYNQKLINELLNIAKKNVKECKDLDITGYKAFISNKISQKKSPIKKNQTYKEKSKGEFEVLTRNEEIKEILENIKKRIIEINKNG